MPPRDPSTVQLDFPALVADLISELRLQGTVGLLDFRDSVQPVYIVSSRGGALSVVAEQVLYETAAQFSNQSTSPAINAVLADTGQLPAGDYDVKAICTWAVVDAAPVQPVLDFQHRNAANTVTLTRVPISLVLDGLTGHTGNLTVDYATTIATDERLRWQVLTAVPLGNISTVVMAKRRVVP